MADHPHHATAVAQRVEGVHHVVEGVGVQRPETLVDGVVKASVKVDGKRALVEGAAERHGARTKVYEQFDDAGFLIKTRGFHRPLLTDMGFRYAGTYVPLVCDTAFVYDLEVKKIPIV